MHDHARDECRFTTDLTEGMSTQAVDLTLNHAYVKMISGRGTTC